jgi:signal transduction histidine kinase
VRQFRQLLQAQYEVPVEFAEISLDAHWGAPQDREPNQVQLIRNRFSGEPPDLVVNMAPSAIDFWLRHRAEIAPGIPSRFVARQSMAMKTALQPGDAAVLAEFSFTQVVDHIVRLLPETRHMVVVFGASELERDLTEEARQSLAGYADRIRFSFTSDLGLLEIKDLVSRLPQHSAVLFGILSIDGQGAILPLNAGLEQLVAVSSAPIFGVFDQELGTGIVGGRLVQAGRMAEEMAAAARRILHDPPAEPVIRLVPLSEPEYDWRVLQRWNIDAGLLPTESDFRFRPPSVWAQYGVWIIIVSAIMTVQTAISIAWFAERRRRRAAERAGDQLSSRIMSVYDDLQRRIASELHDDLSQRLAGLAIDAGFLSRGSGAKGYDDALKRLQPELARISRDVHDLSYRLHPSLVGDLGFVVALRTEVDRIHRQTGIRVDARIEVVETEPSHDVSLCLYRIAQEALNNVVKYAQANMIDVSFRQDADSLLLDVRDNGTGFDVKILERAAGIGISGMRERARQAGGSLQLHTETGKGTRVVARVPIKRLDA